MAYDLELKDFYEYMILHRFCSAKEYEAYQRGEVLINESNHSIKRGSASTSIGFCFFPEDPEEAKHWLAGIVDFDYCVTIEVDESLVRKSRGRYGSRDLSGVEFHEEYCTTSYDNKKFRLVEATTMYSSYAPNHSELKKMFPEFFV